MKYKPLRQQIVCRRGDQPRADRAVENRQRLSPECDRIEDSEHDNIQNRRPHRRDGIQNKLLKDRKQDPDRIGDLPVCRFSALLEYGIADRHLEESDLFKGHGQ